MLGALFVFACAAAGAAGASCYDRCTNSGRCCTGNGSACAQPSCAMGCSMASLVPDEATCNATCTAASNKCSFNFKGWQFNMCGECPARWLDPQTLTPVILPGAEPFFPPGYQLPMCSSCDAVSNECMVGCVMAFNPGFAPGPPVDPPAPPDVPVPPAPWPNAALAFNFSVVFSDHMVLQQAPAMAAVYGPTGTDGSGAAVSVTVTPSSGSPYTVAAAVGGGRWKAFLKPTVDTQGATTFIITANCASGCAGNASSVSLVDVVFGDVWYAAGQSNMVKNFLVTYGGADAKAAIAAGTYDNIRVMSGNSESAGLSPKVPPTHPWRRAKDAAALPADDPDSWWQTSAVMWHFGAALTDQHKAAGKPAPTLGLLSTAIGGSQIEEWMTNDAALPCFGYNHNANGGDLNHVTWDANVRPYLDMTIKGAIYYQVSSFRARRAAQPRAPDTAARHLQKGAPLPPCSQTTQHPPGGKQRGEPPRQQRAKRGLRLLDAADAGAVAERVVRGARHDGPAVSIWPRDPLHRGL